MKNAIILHGTNNDSKKNWFPWLKKELEHIGYEVWVPDLPGAEAPNIKRYNKFIFGNKGFVFNEDTLLIGHSSGAMAILGILQELPSKVKIHAAYLIGAFKDNLGNKFLDGLFEKPFDFEKIKTKSDDIVFIHSNDDPYCPLEHAEYLTKQLDGELFIYPGQKHFSISTAGDAYKKFPKLLDIITATN